MSTQVFIGWTSYDEVLTYTYLMLVYFDELIATALSSASDF